MYHVTDGCIIEANSPKKKKDKMSSMFAGAAQHLDFGALSDQSDDEESGEDKDNKGRQSDEDNKEEKADKDKESSKAKESSQVKSSPTCAAPSTASLGSPKMNIIIQNNSAMKSGYFGKLDFLDSQEDFDGTFGKKPAVLPSNPNRADLLGARHELQNYCDRCKLDIYIHICRQDYIGDEEVDSALNIQEVSRKITSLKQT